MVWYGLENKFKLPNSSDKASFYEFEKILNDFHKNFSISEEYEQLDNLWNFIIGVKENVIDKNQSTYLLQDCFKPLTLFEVDTMIKQKYPYFIEVKNAFFIFHNF